MSRISPIEVTRKFATTVEELADAWAFVMEHIDEVGDSPRITISPVWSFDWNDAGRDDAPTPPRHFGVSVSGMTPDEDR